jgi:hypothetical protein
LAPGGVEFLLNLRPHLFELIAGLRSRLLDHLGGFGFDSAPFAVTVLERLAPHGSQLLFAFLDR